MQWENRPYQKKKEEMDEFYLICLSDPNKNGQVNNKMSAKL